MKELGTTKGRKSIGRAQGRRGLKGGKLRAADGEMGYKQYNRFTVCSNFAKQNCVKVSAGFLTCEKKV